MGSPEELEEELREALNHLYDPLYAPQAPLRSALQIGPGQDASVVQAALIEAIENLNPGPSVPSSAPVHRMYDLLHYRYVQRLKQETTAERLGLSTRYLREQEAKAIRVLARLLAQRGRSVTAETPLKGEQAGEPGGNWIAQVQQELEALEKSAPRPTADVAAIMRSAAGLARAFMREREIALLVHEPDAALMAEIHPSALRQVLLATLREVAARMLAGEITLRAELAQENVSVTISGSPTTGEAVYDLPLVREILSAHDGALTVADSRAATRVVVTLPALPPRKVTVMVVDDNADLVSFYRSHVSGTRYEIVHVPDAESVFPQIEAAAPDIIVLDVMLPDPHIDGWELLVHLHEHPVARAIPVIICSVVRDEELALALGATLYLPKPVRRQQFIRALDEALARAPGA